ncbi:unnamed protein product [Blepharisma stoltei]|uniref:Uncharacterized protein n=1 Tax=Blepharisma stoltei TaxID=1481888 RepID=A0AAU9JGW1_9CILI|nr:unnamed protein product [Blepharisma stoltei]
MSGKIPDLRKLRNIIKESEERIKIADSPIKSAQITPKKENNLSRVDEELNNALGMKTKESNYDKQFLKTIKQEMEELDKELGKHFDNQEEIEDEEDDLCISSESEKEKFISSSPFQLTLQSHYSENSQNIETLKETTPSIKKSENSNSSNEQKNPHSNLKMRLQGALATIKSLEKALKDKEAIIKDLEQEIIKKNKTIESCQSLVNVNSNINRGEGSFKNQLRKKDKEIEQKIKEYEEKIQENKKTMLRMQDLNNHLMAKLKDLDKKKEEKTEKKAKKKKEKNNDKNYFEENEYLKKRLEDLIEKYRNLQVKYDSLAESSAVFEEKTRDLYEANQKLQENLIKIMSSI